MKESFRDAAEHRALYQVAAVANAGVISGPAEGAHLTFVRAPYGPLVETCAAYGIKRSRAYEYARTGLISTFKLGAKTYVRLSSLDSLPERLAASSNSDTAVAS